MALKFNQEMADRLAVLMQEVDGYQTKPNREEQLNRALEIAIEALESRNTATLPAASTQPSQSTTDSLTQALRNAYEKQKSEAWAGNLKRIPTEIKLDFVLEFLIDNRASRMSRGLCDSLKLGVGFNEWKKWEASRTEWLADYNQNYADELCTHRQTFEMFQQNPDYQKLIQLIQK